MNQVAKDLIDAHLDGEDFMPRNSIIVEVAEWVPNGPRRFLLDIGSGNVEGTRCCDLRILRVMTGYDQVTRAIARQGGYLYAYPWM